MKTKHDPSSDGQEIESKDGAPKPLVFFGEVADESADSKLVIYREVKRNGGARDAAVRLVDDVSEDYLAGFLDSVVASPDQEYDICNGTPPRFRRAFGSSAPMPQALSERRLRRVLSRSLLRPRYVPITAL